MRTLIANRANTASLVTGAAIGTREGSTRIDFAVGPCPSRRALAQAVVTGSAIKAVYVPAPVLRASGIEHHGKTAQSEEQGEQEGSGVQHNGCLGYTI